MSTFSAYARALFPSPNTCTHALNPTDSMWDHSFCRMCFADEILAAYTRGQDEMREACAALAKNQKRPFAHDLTEAGQRAKFYQRHIKHAWAQCALKIEQAIRAVSL